MNNIVAQQEAQNKQFLSGLYSTLKNIPLVKLTDKAAVEKFIKAQSKDTQLDEKHMTYLRSSLSLLGRIAHESKDTDTFHNAILKGEIPPVKLTADEAEILKGGESSSSSSMLAPAIVGYVGTAVYMAGDAALGGAAAVGVGAGAALTASAAAVGAMVVGAAAWGYAVGTLAYSYNFLSLGSAADWLADKIYGNK